ncbi:hypothetical protein GCK32_000901 [Trichostrongylus colubriformis]|uniref:Uncharacterized protein n=1 Tax=Trichostrongylus colubriformis TaxID=6319 RepID=A0AAN8F9I6_TRICO
MDDTQKYVLDRAVQRLQNAINNTDRTLLEELPMDGDHEQSALAVEEDHVRRALVNEYQAYWATSGGVEAENTIHQLILLVEAALHLLPQEHAATTASTPLRPMTYTGSCPITSFAHRVAPTPGKIPSRVIRKHNATTWGVSQLLDVLDSSNKTFEAIEDSAQRNLLLVRLVGDGRADHHRAPVEASLVAQVGVYFVVHHNTVLINAMLR